jgi:hypothetical protein
MFFRRFSPAPVARQFALVQIGWDNPKRLPLVFHLTAHSVICKTPGVFLHPDLPFFPLCKDRFAGIPVNRRRCSNTAPLALD